MIFDDAAWEQLCEYAPAIRSNLERIRDSGELTAAQMAEAEVAISWYRTLTEGQRELHELTNTKGDEER